MNTPSTLLGIAGAAGMGVGARWLGARTGIPSIVLLLAGGVVAGPLSGWLDPDALLGDGLRPVVSFATAIVLFEGGLQTSWKELRQVSAVVGRLVSVGLLLTFGGITLLARFALELPWSTASVLGAILVVTGPTVVQPLLRDIRPERSLERMLRLEGVLNDPLGAVLAVTAFVAVEADAPTEAAGEVAVVVARTVVAGVVVGWLGGRLLEAFIRFGRVGSHLVGAVALSGALLLFALGNLLQPEAGLLAVTVAGVEMGSQRVASLEDLRDLSEQIVVFLVSMLFVLLGAGVDLEAFGGVPWTLALFLVGVLGVRSLAVLVSTIGSGLDLRRRAFIGLVGPRGIVAAAVASLFGLELEAEGHDGASLLMPVAFATIATTVAVGALGGRFLVARLGLRVERRGVLILGADAVARGIAHALRQDGLRVLLCSGTFGDVAASRHEGLEAVLVSPASRQLAREVDVKSFNAVVAVLPDEAHNALALSLLGEELPGRCYALPPGPDAPILGPAFRTRRFGWEDHRTVETRLAAGDRFVVASADQADEVLVHVDEGGLARGGERGLLWSR